MSNVVLVEVGQCGNQLGYSILDSLYGHLKGSDEELEMETFFRSSSRRQGDSKWCARAVCIDTEPKVVNECLWRAQSTARWSFDPSSVVYRHGGAGNNWAMGYQMCSGKFLETSLECIRRELELCDHVPSLLLAHSVAGGTGSGLGTHLTEASADEFPDVTRMNIAITPYHFGEVVVQHYNAVLSLSKISSASHAVLVFENEVAQDLCKQMRRIERPTIEDINRTIASNIVPALLPKYSCKSSRALSVSLHDDVTHLCSHPSFRFLDVKSTPQTAIESVDFTYDSWSSILSTLEKMNRKGTASERGLGRRSVKASAGVDDEPPIRNIGSSLTLRGPDALEAALAVASGGADSTVPLSSVSSSSSSSSFSSRTTMAMRDSPAIAAFGKNGYSQTLKHPLLFAHSCHLANGYQRSASLVTNGQSILPILQRAASKSADMFRVGAYVHQYKDFGLETDDFVDAFLAIGQTIENYQALA